MIGKLVLCGLLALTLGAPKSYTPTPKCAPKQFEGVVLGKIAQVSSGQPQVFSQKGAISIDYVNKKEAFHGATDVGSSVIHYSSISDYNKVNIIGLAVVTVMSVVETVTVAVKVLVAS